MKTSIPSSSAAGLDGISVKEWAADPKCMKAGFLNLIFAINEDPSDFRPIRIGSVAVRHLHKIIASRLIDAGVIDERQRSLEDE